MIFSAAALLLSLKRLGWFLLDNWKYVAGVILVLVILGYAYKGCSGGGEVKIDAEAVARMASENEAKRKQEIKEQLEKNADVIVLVDGRTLGAVEDVEERDRIIEQRVKEIDRQIEKKKVSGDVTAEELERLLGGG